MRHLEYIHTIKEHFLDAADIIFEIYTITEILLELERQLEPEPVPELELEPELEPQLKPELELEWK